MSYSAIITHDIDSISKYKSVRNLVGSIRRGVGVAKSLSDFKASRKSRANDPYFNMEEMLEVNNKFGIPSIFYFMAGKSNETFDLNDYNVHDPIIRKLIIDLDKNGASIGLHPSYDSYSSFEIIKNEKDNLEDALGKPVIHSRQHFLNYNENTFRYLAKAGIKYDSTLGSRTLIEYSAEYNKEYVIYSDENVELIEQPFLMMDTHLISDPQKMLVDLDKAVSTLKENDGTAVVIWHNNNYETMQQKELYEKVLSIVAP